MTLQDNNNAEWENPDNWRGGALGIYYSPRDSRVWMPKRSVGLGWTLNFAHRQSWIWAAVIVTIPLVIVGLTHTGK